MSPPEAERCRGFFLHDVRDGILLLLPVSDRVLYRVEALTRSLPASSFLRAGDAIHLTTAREAGFDEIWSNDRHLLAAARYFGLLGRSLTS